MSFEKAISKLRILLDDAYKGTPDKVEIRRQLRIAEAKTPGAVSDDDGTVITKARIHLGMPLKNERFARAALEDLKAGRKDIISRMPSEQVFVTAQNSLTAWLHGHELQHFDTPLDALKSCEGHLPDIEKTSKEDEKKIRAVIGVTRSKLGLPNVLGVYTVDDAKVALKLHEDGKSVMGHQRQEVDKQDLADFIRRDGKPLGAVMIPDGSDAKDVSAIVRHLPGMANPRDFASALANIRDGDKLPGIGDAFRIPPDMDPRMQQYLHGGNARQYPSEKKPPPGYDFVVDASGHSDDLVMQSFNRDKNDNSTYFEKYIAIAGKDRRHQLAYANKRLWVVTTETNMTHDEVMIRRPKLVEEAHPFFISHQMIDKTKSGNDPGEKIFMIDQPFKTIWIERTDGGALFHSPATSGHGWCLGILVREEGPGTYFCEILIAQEDYTRKTHLELYTVLLTPETAFGRLPNTVNGMPAFKDNSMMQTKAHDVLYWTFRRFRSECAFANEKIKPIRARIGTGKERAAVKINRVVRVMLKTERKEYERAVGRAVDWTHKWEVMGHWRRVDGVGKDRDGNYTMRGVTWVAPHVKGKGDLVKKQRVVVDEEES